MGAAKNNNWAILEAEGGRGNDDASSSQIPYSSSVVDTSLPLPLMIPRIMFVKPWRFLCFSLNLLVEFVFLLIVSCFLEPFVCDDVLTESYVKICSAIGESLTIHSSRSRECLEASRTYVRVFSLYTFSIPKLLESFFSLMAVLKVSVKEEEEDKESSITVRLYGPNTDYVINRQRELQVADSFFLLRSFVSLEVLSRVFFFFFSFYLLQ